MSILPPKKDKAAKAAKKEGGEKKARAPRQDYGFAKDAKISLTDGEKTYRGKRLEMYEALKKSDGKTVEHYLDKYLHNADSHAAQRIIDMAEQLGPTCFEVQIEALATRPDSSELLARLECPTLILGSMAVVIVVARALAVIAA